jgi:O-antigen ligase
MTYPIGADVSSTPARSRALPVSLVLAMFVVAMMGRFTLDRLGLDQFVGLDLRLIVCPVLGLAVLLWRFTPGAPPQRHPWAPPLLWAMCLFGYLAMTAFWAPHGALIAERLTDVGALALLVVVTASITAPDPAKAMRVVLAAMFFSGVLYAAAGLLIGDTDAQGRTVAFGGGPNVYVRVVLLGILAAVALTVVYRRRIFLWPIPVLATAALLAGSRGGIIAALATAAVFIVLFWRRVSWRGAAAAVAVVGSALVVVPILLPDSSTALLSERFALDQLIAQDEYSGRPDLFTQAIEIFRDQPVTGGGLDSFYAIFGISQDLGYPHNLVLEVAATGGLIGLALLAGFVLSVLRSARSQVRLSAEQVALLTAAVFIAAASMASGDFYDTRFLWIFSLLAVNRALLPPPIHQPRARLGGLPTPAAG